MSTNISLLVFSVVVLGVMAAIGYFLRGALFSITTIAAQHAKIYAVAYVKGACMISINMIAAFTLAFRPLTADQASKLAWWDWAILFLTVLASGLTTLASFLDKSKAAADAVADKVGPPITAVSSDPAKTT